jgi:hypothetical protein
VELLVSEGRVHCLLPSARRSPGPAHLPARHAA